jgi:polysaccharide deacetylase family protein (PEP-CTERM system associated)
MTYSNSNILNAFCVDLEEWFHVCGVESQWSDPARWDRATHCVEKDTEVLLQLFDEAGVRATFLAIGWVAEKYPRLIRAISDQGHEIGCHGYYHRLVYQQSPGEFASELSRSRPLLQDLSGQAVTCFRAPGFSITRKCLWAYPILVDYGFTVDVSLVPAARDHGGIEGVSPRPFVLNTPRGDITIFPVSIMRLLGKTIPFSGGGYLRLFPLPLIRRGFRQNHRQGLPVMAYIHPREINPDQSRMPLPFLKQFKYYVNLKHTRAKLRTLLREFRFAPVRDVLASLAPLSGDTTVDSQQSLSFAAESTMAQ